MNDRDWKVTYLLMVIVFPYVLIYGLGMPRPIGRSMGAAVFIFGVVGGFTGLSMSSEAMVRPSGKLSQPEYVRARRVFEFVSRAAVFAFAAFFAVYIAVPFAIDLRDLFSSGASVVERGQVVRVTRTIFGLPFIEQSIYLRRGMRTDIRSYTLLHSLHTIRAGEWYEIRSLSRSRVVIEYRHLDAADGGV
jgi:hypothetical protein